MPKVVSIRDFIDPINPRQVNLPENTVYCGRANRYYELPQSPWANPYREGRDGDLLQVVENYRTYIDEKIKAGFLDPFELTGKDLACWGHNPCHCQYLIKIANPEEDS